MNFDEWWNREGQFYDPDTEDVPWYDKRKALAEKSWMVAKAMSTNYTADHDTFPQIITFANGRVVGMKGPGYLFVAPGK